MRMQRRFCCNACLHCPKGGITQIRHNEVRHTFANLLSKQRQLRCRNRANSSDVTKGESFNKKSTTSEDEGRLDIKANGAWGISKIYFDVKVSIRWQKLPERFD